MTFILVLNVHIASLFRQTYCMLDNRTHLYHLNTELAQYSDLHCKSQNNLTIQVVPSHEEFSNVLPLRKTLSPRTHSSRLIKPSLSASKYLKILGKNMHVIHTKKSKFKFKFFENVILSTVKLKSPVILWPRKKFSFISVQTKVFCFKHLKYIISIE